MEETEKDQYKIKRKNIIQKIILIIFVILIIVAIIILFSMYISKEEFRIWVDTNVFRKNITVEDTYTIDLEVDKTNQIYCYDKYICILKDKSLNLYNESGQDVTEIPVNINTAIFTSNNKYLAIAEKNGQEICVILDRMYLWKNKVEGQILQVHLNKNGYLAVITTDTTYKSIITLYDSTGKEILKNYSSTSRVVDVSISDDNKYVAFAEMDTSGTLIQSNVKIISVEKANLKSEEAIIYTYNAPVSKMIVNIQYQDEKILCSYDDSIDIIENKEETEKIPINGSITFTSIDLNNAICYIQEETSGMFKSKSVLNIENTKNLQKNIYNIEETAKEIYTYGNTIGINIGTEIYFINTNGMLIKKYTSNQEITNVMFSDEIAILIYKDRIEIINL